MEEELISALSQVEAKKRSFNAGTDLSKECQSIRELDKRIMTLLTEIDDLKVNISEKNTFVASTCDKLMNTNRILKCTSKITEICLTLGNLNRLCNRIDRLGSFTNKIFSVSSQGTSNKDRTKSSDQPDQKYPQPPVHNEDTSMLLNMVADTCNEFERNYLPLKAILEERKDLPYAGYWNKILQTKAFISSVHINDKG